MFLLGGPGEVEVKGGGACGAKEEKGGSGEKGGGRSRNRQRYVQAPLNKLPLSECLIPSLLKSGPKKQPKHKVFGRDIPGTPGTQTSGYPGQKLYAGGLFLLFWTGSGRDVPGFGSGRPGFGKTLCKETSG